jgi:hypothetical protein
MSVEKKISIAKALVSQLHSSEEAIDTALIESSHLIETYVTSRRAIGVSATIGSDVHRHTLEAMMALRLAQEHMTAAHKGLTELQADIGLRHVAIIPAGSKPEKDSKEDRRPVFKVEQVTTDA